MLEPVPAVCDVVILECLPCPPHASGPAAGPKTVLLNFRVSYSTWGQRHCEGCESCNGHYDVSFAYFMCLCFGYLLLLCSILYQAVSILVLLIIWLQILPPYGECSGIHRCFVAPLASTHYIVTSVMAKTAFRHCHLFPGMGCTVRKPLL